jgi:hypothetical protein
MSSFADFNVGSLKLNHLGEITRFTGSELITPTQTATWNELITTIQNVEEIAQEVILKEDHDNKSINVSSDSASDTKYPSVKAVKTYVDGRVNEQNQFINSTLQTLQSLQEGLNNSNQVDSTKENVSNKSTNVETDAASDTKYPSVKAIKSYVDKVRSSLLLVEGESTLNGHIHWTCGACPMEGLNGLLLPSNGKIRRIAGLAYGPLGNLTSIRLNLRMFTVTSTTHTPSELLRTITFGSHPTLSMLYALDKVNENILPSVDGSIMLLFEESLPRDISLNTVSIPPYIRFRITIEYESYI